jgi:hypothetical protein
VGWAVDAAVVGLFGLWKELQGKVGLYGDEADEG